MASVLERHNALSVELKQSGESSTVRQHWPILAVISSSLLLLALRSSCTVPTPRTCLPGLSYWVKEIQNLSNEHEARKAVHTIGPSGIPFLQSAAAREDSVLRTWYRWAWPHLPTLVQRRLPKPETRLEGLPKLAHVYAEVGPPAITSLTRMFDDRDGGIRVNAVIALSGMRGDRTSAVPALIRAITNSDKALAPGNPWASAGVKRMAATVLGQIGPVAQTAVPVLTELLGDTNEYTRAQAAVALWRITDDGKYISLLTADLETAKDLETINRTVEALGDIGSAAIVALPAIRKKFASQGVSGDLLEAILKIDPDAVLRQNIVR